ncbi:MAG: ABC transporter permease subunit [Aureispira sp.]
MLQYIFKRILIFIPTFFVISLLIFGLSKLAPGDPVLILMGANDSNGVGQRADLVNGEKAYAAVATQLGLDKPSFYVLLTSAAYPKDLYQIKKSNHRETLSRLLDSYGNSEATMAYYETLKRVQYEAADLEDVHEDDYKLRSLIRENIEALFNEYTDAAIRFQLEEVQKALPTASNTFATFKDRWAQLIKDYDYLINHPTPTQRYIPTLHYYGFDNQYHTWMFGDYPWLSSVDSSGYFRIEELSTIIKDIVPQKRANDRTISRIRGQLQRTKKAIEVANNSSKDSLQTALAQLSLDLQGATTQQQTYQSKLDVLGAERDSISAVVPRYVSKGFLRGDFGISYFDKKTVASKIGQALYWTLIMNLFAILIAYCISIPLGIRSAVWKIKGHKRKDAINTTVLFILYSLPSFWIGTLLLVFFTTGEYSPMLDWFPTSGAQDLELARDPNTTWWEKVLDAAHHLVLPIFCITYGSLAYLSRQMRGAMLGVLRQDYIRTARAKGLNEHKILWKHAFRNALFPIITMFSSIFPRAISGSIAIELIYAIPGMGQLVLSSIVARDWPVVFTVVMLVAILTMIGNLIADILYAIVDPRLSYKA